MFNHGFVEYLQGTYPPGTVIMLEHMGDDPNPIPPGTRGTVQCVDDMGQIHCLWENGRTLALVPGEDEFHKIKTQSRDDMER